MVPLPDLLTKKLMGGSHPEQPEILADDVVPAVEEDVESSPGPKRSKIKLPSCLTEPDEKAEEKKSTDLTAASDNNEDDLMELLLSKKSKVIEATQRSASQDERGENVEAKGQSEKTEFDLGRSFSSDLRQEKTLPTLSEKPTDKVPTPGNTIIAKKVEDKDKKVGKVAKTLERVPSKESDSFLKDLEENDKMVSKKKPRKEKKVESKEKHKKVKPRVYIDTEKARSMKPASRDDGDEEKRAVEKSKRHSKKEKSKSTDTENITKGQRSSKECFSAEAKESASPETTEPAPIAEDDIGTDGLPCGYCHKEVAFASLTNHMDKCKKAFEQNNGAAEILAGQVDLVEDNDVGEEDFQEKSRLEEAPVVHSDEEPVDEFAKEERERVEREEREIEEREKMIREAEVKERKKKEKKERMEPEIKERMEEEKKERMEEKSRKRDEEKERTQKATEKELKMKERKRKGNDEENFVCEKNEDQEKVDGVVDEELERSKADQERSQLEVPPSKTRSNKRIADNGDSGDDEASKEGFHNSFLDFLKSKDVEKEESNGRCRHKSEGEREGRSRTVAGRSRSSHSPYHRSRSSNRAVNGRSKSRGRSKSKAKSKGAEESASESSDTEGKVKRLTRRGHHNRGRETSPSGSDADSVTSRPTSRRSRRGKAAIESEASSDEESKSRASSPVAAVTKISPRKKRSELDKLLEAVDTSFHFETAAAERKRLNDSGLGPLEIDCSDTGSEASTNVVTKRKASEIAFDEESKLKKQKVGNNLLKTASPGSRTNSELPSGSEQGSEFEYDGCGSNTAWNGWELLSDQLQSITHSPVEIDRLYFSFESEPSYEGWYSTYQRQDRGDEHVFYPNHTSAPFLLPYEMPYGTFLPGKAGATSRREETPLSCSSRSQSKATSPVRGTIGRKGKSRKVSETDSTDSSEDPRRGTRSGKGKGKQLPPLPPHLQEPNYRVSPRQHASTKSFLTGSEADGGVGELEDLAEAYIMRDEAELHFPNLSYAGNEDSNDSYSSESVKSRSAAANRVGESTSELSLLVSSIDRSEPLIHTS